VHVKLFPCTFPAFVALSHTRVRQPFVSFHHLWHSATQGCASPL